MLTSSAKAKGRRLCLELQELLYKYAPDLKKGDIDVTSSGANGRDMKLSPAARELYPLAIECKNQEKINIWEAYEQAQSHLKCDNDGTYPVVFFKRNRSPMMVTLSAEDFIRLIR